MGSLILDLCNPPAEKSDARKYRKITRLIKI